MEVFECLVEARGWGRETKKVSASEEFCFRQELGWSSSWSVDNVVPRVDAMLQERGESLQDVVSGMMRLGVEECPSFVHGWCCGGGGRVGDLASPPDGRSAGGEEVA